MHEIIKFEDKRFGSVRIVEKDGEPWWVAKDVCDVLGYMNHSKALSDHVDDDEKLNNESLSSLGQRGGWLIKESGLYSLILRSQKPEAKAFKKWVTSEVLPSIRKNGKYEFTDKKVPSTFAEALRLAADQAEEIERMKPRYELAEAAIRDTDKHYSIRDAGKHFGLRQTDVFSLLRSHNLLTSKNLPTQKALDENILILRTNVKGDKNYPQAVFTMEGMSNFRDRYVTRAITHA